MEIIKTISVGRSWTDINISSPALEQKFTYLVENISSIPLRYVVNNSTTQPTGLTESAVVMPDEVIIIPKGSSHVWFTSDVDSSSTGKILVSKALSYDIRSSIRKSPRLADTRLLTQTLTQNEIGSIEGRLYFYLVDISIPASTTRWLSFQCPSDKECAILSINASPSYTGFELQIVEGSSGLGSGTQILPKSRNRNYGVNSTASISLLTNSPTTPGTIYDIPVFIPLSGTNPAQRQATVGSREEGYLVYGKGSGYQLKMINTSTEINRVILRVSWLEATDNILDDVS
jgi:ribosomal protein L30E